ncbi:Anucleate primary sterigmata protein A-like protein [Hapsidospora chrysogenum ATCC 11550]|uniref:Anucleate primary sterigmata protein A-like protein n=1 Tax=Hapsidospora chrysogenum (strain ATCC 11550 / CBS 779.69 / DSM 880 / IAM 14645 / JCM 23072 / IMI 49137) TaxID=857340 RepID=A0A086TC98_HAPC1|nr:Anucleate primary sterigmata protein A-like protein [Hapsidospora chrysogenum ATCC 11550]
MASFTPDSRLNLPAPASDDPFVTNAPANPPVHHRFSNFDHELFAAGPGSSPRQAKRALEAHLAETERRLDEAGKLGTALVTQRKTLTEQLQEVEKLQAEGELGPELRQKLVEIEKEYNDLARESARAFLPKQRVPSNEVNPGSPFVPEGRSGRRSVSPSKFESQATGSPTKLSVPNRKIRNQPSNRVHDIEFAAEISTSLIAQVRNLQSLLAERDEEVRDLKNDKSALEIESESLQQRLKALDESEHRYKEENWNLETRLQELTSQQREAADREKKLTQALNASKTDKNVAQKELDEVKLSHAKLTEEHAAVIKHHDIELGTAKRNAVMAEGERAAMQRKIDDLTNQNQELAKAFSTQRGRALERESVSGQSEDDFETATDNVTPEHSPPPSPVKGTPRHSMLETETMKTSLHHAQRTIQSQRSLIHREKTEKLELRRMIQDLRDDLERARADPGAGATNRRSKKMDSKEFNKRQSRLLGSFRSSRQEILMDDPEWEEHQGQTSSANVSPVLAQGACYPTDSSDHFDTANEASESAFETANERATETEGFQTGNEEFSDDDGAATETETNPRGFGRMGRPPSLPAGLSRHVTRESFDSTASTSGDDDNYPEAKTPTATISSQRSRFRLGRAPFGRNSRQASEDPTLQSSPISLSGSASGTPQAPAQSLFAELQDFGGSDDESIGNATPSRRSARSVTPGSTRRAFSPPPAVPPLPKVIMVDSGVMTDPVEIRDDPPAVIVGVDSDEADTPKSVVFTETQDADAKRESISWLTTGTNDSRRLSTASYSDAGAQYDEARLSQFPVPPSLTFPPRTLSLSSIQSEMVEPREEVQVPPTPPALCFTPVITASVEPQAEPEVAPPALSLSVIAAEHLEPVAQPVIPPPTLSLSTVSAEHVEPIELPETPVPELTMTSIMAEVLDPRAEPELPAPYLTMSSILREEVEPIVLPEPELTPESVPMAAIAAPVVPEQPELSMSALVTEHVEPVAEPEVVAPAPVLGLSSIHAEHLEPVAEPEVLPEPIPLGYSNISTEQVEPVSEPAPLPPTLALSSIAAQDVTPVPQLPPAPPKLVLSAITAEGVEPLSPVDVNELPNFGFSTIDSVETRPITPRSPRRDAFILPRDRDQPETPENRAFDSVFGSSKNKESPTIIAEDETRQSPRETPKDGTPESQRPFSEISANADTRPQHKVTVLTSDQGAQTSLTADAIDQLFKTGTRKRFAHERHPSASSIGSPGTTGTVRIHRPHDGPSSPTLDKGKGLDDAVSETGSIRRPGSAASGRTSLQDAPPLPSNHRELIEAARSGSANGPRGEMGPPLWPASAIKRRPRTPSVNRPTSGHSARATPTPRALRSHSAQGNLDVPHSPTRMSARSRKSSVSSFASELDSRFNMRQGEMGDPTGLGPNTDPRMIQAITQTMIGEFMWKYTRKTGRGEMSEKRHRRYFWVHPYTRTLYWSDRDPSSAGRAELKAKSVPIEAVRVVTDDNPMPPGLHRKSLIIIAPGRTVKFTCTTGQRHETWFNALSYLLLRTNTDGQSDVEDVAENITREDVDEFNPQYGQRPANGTRRTPPSLSSYNSRTTHNQSPTRDVSMDIPTLTPAGQRTTPQQAQKASVGSFGRLSGYWRNSGSKLSGTFSSRRTRGPTGHESSIYEASEVHDSAEDLREMIERQDREAGRLENVRACCDGKHDVGQLSHSKKGRGGHSHSHPGSSAMSTPMASIRSRA